MWIPGFGSEEVRPYKKSATTEAHKQVGFDFKHYVHFFFLMQKCIVYSM